MSCHSQTKKEAIEKIIVNRNIPGRDSAQIMFTLRAWYDMGWFTFENYDRLHYTMGKKGQLTIEGFFCDPDSTRIIVWVSEQIPNYRTVSEYSDDSALNRLCPEAADEVFSMFSLVGIRENKNSLWRLYPLELVSAYCSNSKEEVIQIFREYFFSEMANSVMYVRREVAGLDYGGKIRHDLMKNVSGYQEGTYMAILKELGYNLQDINFWQKSLIWQKGSYLDGYYSFQVWGKDTLKIPAITYPDSLLKLFQETTSNTN